MNWTPVQKLSVGAGAALTLLALFGLVAFASASRLTTQRAAVSNANEAVSRLDQLVAAVAETERAGVAFMVTGNDDELRSFEEARRSAEEALDELGELTQNRPAQRTALDSLRPIVGARFTTLTNGISIRRNLGESAAEEFARADTAGMGRHTLIPLVRRVRDEELRVLGERTRLQAQTGQATAFVILAGSILAFMLAAVAFTPIRPTLAARLTRSLTTPGGISAVPELRDAMREAARMAEDRLSRLQQVVHALSQPQSAAAKANVLITRGPAGLSPAAALVAQRNGDTWRVLAQRQSRTPDGGELPSDLVQPLRDAVRTKEPVVVESRVERDKLYPSLPSFGAGPEVALVAVPLDESRAFVVALDKPRVFGEDERAYLATLGRLGGLAFRGTDE